MRSVYLNTDVDIVSPNDLGQLANFLDERCALLRGEREDDGLWHIRIEAEESGETCREDHTTTSSLSELLDVFENLDDNMKRLLATSSKFDFDIGWQASEHRPEGTFTIPNDLLHRISNLGATLTVTVYPSSENYPESDEALLEEWYGLGASGAGISSGKITGLMFHDISDAALKKLGELTTLNHLTLSYKKTKLSDSNFESLIHFEHLSLTITGPKVSKEEVKKLQLALPNCRIDWDGK